MERETRGRIASGILLIVLGLALLAYQFVPVYFPWLPIELSWPFIVIGVGVFLFILGLLVGAPGLAIPATIVTGIGVLLYYQNATGDWDSWAYAWTLIPGFVGIGIIIAGLLGGESLRKSLEGGGVLVLISLVMYAIFGSFLGGQDFLGDYWPVLLILAGLYILLRSMFSRKSRQDLEE